MRARQRSFVFAIALAAVLALSQVAFADTLSEYLQRSKGAEFSGREAVSCDTPDGHRDVIVNLTQVDGSLSVKAAVGSGAEVEVGVGSVAVVRPDGSGAGTIANGSSENATGHYEVASVEDVSLLGRLARRVTVEDASGVRRAVMTFDVETGALLASDIRNADGSTYCAVEMITFQPGSTARTATTVAPANMQSLETVDAPDDERLPDEVSGFLRLETYRWNDGGVVAYYSDGLFSFTLLTTDRAVQLADQSVTMVESGGGSYARWFGPGQVMYVWETRQGGATLYGDLPVDLQNGVLADLPTPGRPGLLTRWWRSIFG